jgi:DNA primase
MSLGNVQITPQLVQAVRDAADIVSVASEHTRLRKAGRRHQGLCPIHKEKTPSFSVDPVQGLFYCFGCGAGGDAIKLHMLTTGDDFPAAIESLATRFGVPLPTKVERRPGGVRAPERDIEGALAAAAEFFIAQLRKDAFPRKYLEDRRIPPELIEKFGLGYAPEGWRTLVQALHPRIPMADLEAAGLAARSEKGGEPYDRFRHRLMFPIHNASGRLVGFGGRTLGDDKAKYVNTNETDRFHKGLLLYGLHQAKREIRETGRAVLCEGYFDVIGSVACGLEGAVAGMGTALTPEQAKLLSRYAEDVVIAYDGDNAGENAARRALPLLLAEGLGVRRARFPGGHDPDSLRLAEGEAAVAEVVRLADDAVMLELDKAIPPGAAREPQLQAKAATAVAELLRPIPDAVVRHGYARLAAQRLDIPVEMLARRAARGDSLEKKLERGTPFSSPQATETGPPRLVRSLEEQVLDSLIQGEELLPALEELPPPDVFFDTECRNIYQAFRALYAEGMGSRPEVRALQERLGYEGRAVDRMAKILLEGSFAPGRTGLLVSLENLARRWKEQRLRELVREINEAQQRGLDPESLARLYQEKRTLSLSIHRRSRPGANEGFP